MKQILIIFLSLGFLFLSCQKEKPISTNTTIQNRRTPTAQEQKYVQRFEHASYVLAAVLANKSMRQEFSAFIKAKLQKSGTDEELTFREIFSDKQISLPGVNADFLIRFQKAFVQRFLDGNYRHKEKYSHIEFTDATSVKQYFGIDNNIATSRLQLSSPLREVQVDPGFEIYYPYSENFEMVSYDYYAVSYNPLVNDDENEGEIFDAATGNYMYVAPIDDAFAEVTPTFIVTVDDALSLSDFSGGNPISSRYYKINITNDDYNATVLQSLLAEQTTEPNPSPCTKELRVRDGRWTLLNNGYGIFEGAIEFAVAVSRDVSEVNIPSQLPQTNPVIKMEKTAHAWGYIKLKRKKVKKMQADLNEHFNLGLYVGPWCEGQADKMVFIYEYDKPWLLSENSKEFSGLMSAGIGLVGNKETKEKLKILQDAGLAPVIQAFLEGTAQSRIEHYGIIGSAAVLANQGVPTNGMYPGILNGYRPYGTYSALVTFVVD